MPKRNSYSRKFKQTVVEDLRKNHLSYSESHEKILDRREKRNPAMGTYLP